MPALLSAFFHTAWIVILLVYAGATGSWPQACATSDGVAYIAVLGGLLFSYALNLAIDLALTLHSLRGAPFEASKRRWVAPLLYASTLPLVTALGLTGARCKGGFWALFTSYTAAGPTRCGSFRPRGARLASLASSGRCRARPACCGSCSAAVRAGCSHDELSRATLPGWLWGVDS